MKLSYLFAFVLLSALPVRQVAAQNQPWIFKSMLTQTVFDAEHANWSAAPYGFQISSLNGITVQGNIFYDAVWTANSSGRVQHIRRGISREVFILANAQHQNAGRGLIWVSGFEGPNGPLYNALWEEGAPTANRAVAVGLTKTQLDAEIASNSAAGRELYDVLSFVSGPQILYNGLWQPAGNPLFANVVRYQQTLTELDAEVESRFSNNWQLIRITGGQTLNGERFCSVWRRGFARQHAYVHMRTMPSGFPSDINEQIDNALFSGYRPQWVQQYNMPVGQNNSRHFITSYVRNGGLPIQFIERLREEYPYHIVGISYQGRLVYAAGHPTPKNRGGHWPALRANHRVRIGSVSKMITATAILDLVNRDMLSLDDRVLGPGSIFGNEIGWRANRPFTAWEQQITIRHLLTMTSGFASEPDWHPYTDNPDVLAILDQWIHDHNPVSAPGTIHRYVNANTAMAGAVIERISGMSYENYCRQRILRPAGIRDQDMTFLTGSLTEHQAGEPFYIYNSSLYPPDLYSTELHWRINNPGGGWIARAQDALMFLRRVDQQTFNKDILPHALLNERFDTLGALFANSETPSNYGLATMNYDFGWGHNGAFPQAGGKTWLLQLGDIGLFVHRPVVDMGLPNTLNLRRILLDITEADAWPRQLNLFDSVNTGYDAWVQTRFPAGMRANASFRHRFTSPNADPDGDGHANIVEYYHGLNPLEATPLPQLSILRVEEGMAMEWWQRMDATGVRVIPQRSPNLGLWGNFPSTTQVSSNRPGFYRRRHVFGLDTLFPFGRLRYELD